MREWDASEAVSEDRGALLPREEGSAYVDHYGKEALYQTPLENPYVIELLEKLGFSTVEDFLEKSDLLTRHF